MRQLQFLQITAIILIGLNLRPVLASISPLIKVIQDNTHANSIIMGLLTTLPVLVMGLGALLTMPMRHILGEKKGIQISLIFISLACLLRLWADNTLILIASSIFAGIGIALAQALIPSYIKQQYKQQTNMIFGLYATAIMGGAVLASLSSPWLLEYLPWNLTLAIWLIPSILTICLWSIANKRYQVAAIIDTSLSLNTIRKSSRAWLLAIFFGLGTGGYMLVLAWLAPYYISLSYSPIRAGSLLAIVTFSEVIAGLLVSSIIQYFNDKRPLLFLAIGCLLLGLILIVVFPISFDIIATILLGLGIGMLFSLSLIIMMDHTNTPTQAATLSGFVQGIGYLIAALFPLLAGIILENFTSLIMAWIMMGFISAILFILALNFAPVKNKLI